MANDILKNWIKIRKSGRKADWFFKQVIVTFLNLSANVLARRSNRTRQKGIRATSGQHGSYIRPTKPVSHNLARTILEQGRCVPPGQNTCTIKTIVFTSHHANPNYRRFLVTIPWTILDTIIALRFRLICAMRTDCGHHRCLEYDSTRIFIVPSKTLYPTSRRFPLSPFSPKLQRKFYQRSRSNTFNSFCNESRRSKRVKRRSKKTTMMMMDLAQRFT